MKEKFYVPFNTAQMLKANGYNEECERFYDHSGMLTPRPIVNNNKHLDHIYHDMKMYSAPTYHEVLDWLESKDILIDCTCGFDYHTEEEWYRCFVIERKKRFRRRGSGQRHIVFLFIGLYVGRARRPLTDRQDKRSGMGLHKLRVTATPCIMGFWRTRPAYLFFTLQQ